VDDYPTNPLGELLLSETNHPKNKMLDSQKNKRTKGTKRPLKPEIKTKNLTQVFQAMRKISPSKQSHPNSIK
jgi:hypothetical protein